MLKLVFDRIKRKINSQSRCGILPLPVPMGALATTICFWASELSDPSPGGPGREMQMQETAPSVSSVSGQSRGISGRVRAAWGVLCSLPHPGSAETSSKGSCKGKTRSQKMQLEGRVWQEVGSAHATWPGRCRDRRWAESAGDPPWGSSSLLPTRRRAGKEVSDLAWESRF